MKIPFTDVIEWSIGFIKSKYTIEKPVEESFMVRHESKVLPLPNTKTTLPATEPQPQLEQQNQTQSNKTSAATSLVSALGVLHICGYLMFLKFTC
jgi:hypothetical protein